MSVAELPQRARPDRVVEPALTTTASAEGTRIIVGLRGEADLSTRPVLSNTLSRVIAMRTGDVVIDLAEVSFIDTAIVRTFTVCQQLLSRHGRRLTFRSPSRLAARMLQAFGLSDLIEAREKVQLNIEGPPVTEAGRNEQQGITSWPEVRPCTKPAKP